MTLSERITGCILGTAVGDALGLPREGLSRRRAGRLFGTPPLRYAMLGRRGLCSDDTEHTIMVAQSLIESRNEPASFGSHFAHRLRRWITRVPAGVGFGTFRACGKLWLGYGPNHSGVPSAGNGPAMRSALLGLVAKDREELNALVKASTRVTHTDPRAEQGALIVALGAHLVSHSNGEAIDSAAIADRLTSTPNQPDLYSAMSWIGPALAQQQSAEHFAAELCGPRGVSGFVNNTVPAAVYCWLAHRGDFRSAVESAVALGGDSDTVGAITGALAGMENGSSSIPDEWIAGLAEWPCTVTWMRQLANALAARVESQEPARPPEYSGALMMLRNAIFLGVVLGHGLRRLLPPY